MVCMGGYLRHGYPCGLLLIGYLLLLLLPLLVENFGSMETNDVITVMVRVAARAAGQ